MTFSIPVWERASSQHPQSPNPIKWGARGWPLNLNASLVSFWGRGGPFVAKRRLARDTGRGEGAGTGATFVLIPSLVPFSPWDTSREQRGDKEPFFPRAGHNPDGVRGTGVGLVGPIPNLSQPPGLSAGAAKTPSSPKCTHGGAPGDPRASRLLRGAPR